MAERVGFEPTVGCPITSFQDWLLKPLGHLSRCRNYTIYGIKSQEEEITAKSLEVVLDKKGWLC